MNIVKANNVNFQPDQLGRKFGATLRFASRRPKFNQNILTHDAPLSASFAAVFRIQSMLVFDSLVMDLVFSKRVLVTRPVEVDDVTCA